MQVVSIAIFSALVASLTAGFKNTGPVYIKAPSSNSELYQEELTSYMEASAFNKQIESNVAFVDVPTIIFQLSKDLYNTVYSEQYFQQFFDSSQVVEKVRYENSSQDQLKGFKFQKLSDFDIFSGISGNVIINGIQEESLKEFQLLLSKLSDEKATFIAQFVPSFESETTASSSSLMKLQRREIFAEEISADSEKLSEELSDIFDKLIEEAKVEGGLVTIQNGANKSAIVEDVNDYKNTGNFEETKVTDGSLFDTYQFFSSGILSAIIVSLFLVYVLVQGLAWVSSLQVSYRALERPVDGRKKNK